jgi:N1221-like protein
MDAASIIDDGRPDRPLIKADEVDQTGTDISTVSDDQLMAEVVEGLKAERARGTGDLASHLPSFPGNLKSPVRPELRRDAVAPPPPIQPPPPAPGQQMADPADSLSLAQLRRIVQEIPKMEQPAYTFRYADTQPFPEELEEWFQYHEPDRMMLLGSKVAFEHNWQAFCDHQELSWLAANHDLQASFMKQILEGLRNPDRFARIEALEAVCYAITGVWGLTGGRSVDDFPEEVTAEEAAETPKARSLQIRWIENSVLLVQECSGIPVLFECMRRVFDKDEFVSPPVRCIPFAGANPNGTSFLPVSV